jgi:hypothetical protein
MLNSISFLSLSMAMPLSFFMFSNSPLCFSRASSSSPSRSLFCLKNSLECNSQFLTSSSSSLLAAISLSLSSSLTTKSVLVYLRFSTCSSALSCYSLSNYLYFLVNYSFNSVFLVIYSVFSLMLWLSIFFRSSYFFYSASHLPPSFWLYAISNLARSYIWKMEILLSIVSCFISFSSR